MKKLAIICASAALAAACALPVQAAYTGHTISDDLLREIAARYQVDLEALSLASKALDRQLVVTPEPQEPETPEVQRPVIPGTQPEQSPSYSVGSVSAYEAEVVRLVNEERAARGLPPLSMNSALSDVARAKSRDMAENNYFDHTSPTYGSPYAMMKSFGIIYRTAGENIAYGYATPEAVVQAWMNSEGHRANILKATYTQIGVGYVADGDHWTQMFIS